MITLTTLAILVPVATAVVVATVPRSEARLARAIGLLGAMIELGVLLGLVRGFDPTGEAVQHVVDVAWLPGYGVNLSFGVDGRALGFLLVVGFVAPLGLALGGRSNEPPPIVGLLVLEAAWVTVILARDLVILAAAWELATVLVLLLIGRRSPIPARRLAVQLLPGAVALLGAVVVLGVGHAHATGGAWSWDLDALATVTLPPATQSIGFTLALISVATTLPLIGLHGGLVSVCVAGSTPVVATWLGAGMPMAVFVLVRVAIPLFPLAAGDWTEALTAIAVIGSVYAGLVCWAEREPGRLLAHVALLHLGLAIVAAVSGSASAGVGLGFYLLGHGLGLTLLTASAHGLRRDGVDNLGELAGWSASAPRSVALALIGTLLLLGIPGSPGFVGELAIVIGVVREVEVELVRPTVWGLLAPAAVGLGTLGLLRTIWQASRGRPSTTRITDLDRSDLGVGIAAIVIALGFGLAPGWLIARSETAEKARVERLHYARCLAIEARGSARPRTHAELVHDRGAVCLDPVGMIRLDQGREVGP